MKKLVVVLATIMVSLAGMSQTLNDAYNLSSVNYGSTARSAAMGGAFGALGADFSSIAINPAGLGVYRSGEFTFTPNFYFNSSNSDYLGTNSTDNRVGLNFTNLGLVFSTPTLKKNGVKSVNFSIGYNRLKDFNRNTYISGYNSEATQLDFYTQDLVDYGEENALWDSYLAYQGWLVDRYFDETDQLIYEPVILSDVTVDQSQSIYEKGKIDEWNFALGLSINDNIYVGASFGIRDVYYRNETVYGESFNRGIDNNSYSQWDEVSQSYIFYQDGGFESSNYLTTDGYGFNAKLGLIFRPVDALRLGFALHTPTYYVLEDNYSYVVDPNILVPEGENDNRPDIQSYEATYQYAISTSPLNFELSMAYVFGKYGVFSFDYGYSDYSGMSINERNQNTGQFNATNQLISDVLKSGNSLRAGLELKASPNFSLRGGISRYSSAFGTNADNYSFDKPGALMQYSAGFGYRDNDFFIDFAYVMQHQNNESSLFILDNSLPTAITDYSSNKFMMTVGFRF